MQEGYFITRFDTRRIFAENAEVKAMIPDLMKKIDKLERRQGKGEKGEFVSIKELEYELRRSKTTVKNTLAFDPRIRRKKEGRKMNLVHRIDFLEAYERYKKTPFQEKLSTGKNLVRKVG